MIKTIINIKSEKYFFMKYDIIKQDGNNEYI